LSLPIDTIGNWTQRWDLEAVKPIKPENSRGGTEFMAQAILATHGTVILKYARGQSRLTAEIATLRHYNGIGAVKVFEQAPEDGLYLMQTATPGRQLATLYHEGRDDEGSRIIAGLIKTLTRQQPNNLPEGIPPVEDLLVHFERFFSKLPLK